MVASLVWVSAAWAGLSSSALVMATLWRQKKLPALARAHNTSNHRIPRLASLVQRYQEQRYRDTRILA